MIGLTSLSQATFNSEPLLPFAVVTCVVFYLTLFLTTLFTGDFPDFGGDLE